MEEPNFAIDENARYKFGCETDSNWEKRRLNFERKGTQVECLQKGYGYGESHSFYIADSETLNPTELRNLENWGISEGMHDRIWTTLDDDNDFKFPLVSETQPTFLYSKISPGFKYQLLNEDLTLSSENIFMCLEEFQKNEKDGCYFMGSKRTPGGRKQLRDFRFLEDSFSLQRIQDAAFDTEDFQRMFLVRRHPRARFIFVLEGLTTTLGTTEYQIACEVNFSVRKIVFYCRENSELKWYSRIMMQQFALTGQKWAIYTFLVDSLESLMVAVITRMAGGSLNAVALRTLPNKQNQILGVLSNIA